LLKKNGISGFKIGLEQKNAKKRKSQPLTNSEALSFFFIPIGFAKWRNWENTDFNASEMDRFRKFGFERKIKQAHEMRIYGAIFYISIAIIITYLFR